MFRVQEGGIGRHRARLLALCCALAPFVVLELVLRACGMRYPRYEIPIQIWNADRDQELAQHDGLHRHDDRQLWAPREGALIPWTEGERVSAHGFRGEDPDPGAAWKVLALGDSSTFGWQLAGHETWAALLEADLQRALDQRADGEPGRVQVVNGGVIGSTIRQGLERYRAVSADWRPDVVIAGFGTSNEHVPTMDMVDVDKIAWLGDRRSLSWRAQRFLRNEVRVVGLAAWVLDELSGGREVVLAGFVERERERRLALQHYEELDDYPRRVSPADFQACLAELLGATRENGSRLVLVRMPRRASVELSRPQVLEYDAELERFLAQGNGTFVDARSAMRERFAAGVPEDALLQDGSHPTAQGQRIVADCLLSTVLAKLAAAGSGR